MTQEKSDVQAVLEAWQTCQDLSEQVQALRERLDENKRKIDQTEIEFHLNAVRDSISFVASHLIPPTRLEKLLEQHRSRG